MLAREPVTLANAVARIAAHSPGRAALWYGGYPVCYAELLERSQRVAASLARLGIGRGDCVSLWLPNAPAWLVLFLALARIGAIALATNTRFRSMELGDILLRARTKAVVYWPGFRGIDFDGVLKDVAPSLPELRWLVEYTEDGTVGPAIGAVERLRYADLESATPMTEEIGCAADPCVIYTTSGTTRRPKLAMHSQSSLVIHAHDVGRSLGYAAPGAATLQMLPLCGTFGLSQAMAALLSGAPMALHHSFDPVLAGALIREHRLTLAALTDEMIRRIYEHQQETVPFPGLRLFTGSRAHELVGLSEARGFPLIGLYGSSEVQALFSRRPEQDPPMERARGGGFPVSPSAAVRVRDTVTGELKAHGETGEIEIRDPATVTIGYFGDPEATAQAMTADGYFRTGDLGFTSADGSFTFISRIGDAIRLRGFLVSPLEVESFIREHAHVDQCYVVGVDTHERTVPVAFYTATEGERIDEGELRDHCLARMAHYKVPEHFVRVARFSYIDSANTPKVDRKLLREHAARVVAAAADRAAAS